MVSCSIWDNSYSCAFKRAKLHLALAYRINYSCELIPNWTRNHIYYSIEQEQKKQYILNKINVVISISCSFVSACFAPFFLLDLCCCYNKIKMICINTQLTYFQKYIYGMCMYTILHDKLFVYYTFIVLESQYMHVLWRHFNLHTL